VCSVTDHIELAAGQPGREQIDQFPCQLGLRGPLGIALASAELLALGLPAANQDRQAHRPLKERQTHHDPDHDPVVAPRGRRLLGIRGRVVMPEARVDLAAQAMQESVIDGNQHRRSGLAEPLHDHHRQPQPEFVHRPASVAEEPVRASVMPDPDSRAPTSISVTHRNRVWEI
jgi:hypothetical protein